MASDTQHGQVRALVERAIEARDRQSQYRRKQWHSGRAAIHFDAATQDIAAIRAAADALDAARTQATPITQEAWEPIAAEHSVMCACGDPSCYRALVVGMTLIEAYRDVSDPQNNEMILIDLPDDVRLCRLVLTGAPTPGEGEHEQAAE